MPTAQSPAVTVVHSDRAIFHGEVDPNGTPTKADFEYVDDATFEQSGWANAQKTSPETEIGMSKHYQSVSQSVNELIPDTLYHYRVVGNNEMGSGNSAATFTTFAFIPSFNDPCPNAHVRQQTGASLLLDCRAYELVSAANAGGYDVESNLVPGQTPFGGYPDAENPSQILYGVHDGGIPGTGNPTNNGVDPYVATRGEEGWSTTIRRHSRKRPLRDRLVLLTLCSKPTHPLTPSPSAAPKSARRALPTAAPATRSTCPTANSCRAMAGSISDPPPNPPASSAAISPPTAPTSSSAPKQSSSLTPTKTATQHLRPRPEDKKKPTSSPRRLAEKR